MTRSHDRHITLQGRGAKSARQPKHQGAGRHRVNRGYVYCLSPAKSENARAVVGGIRSFPLRGFLDAQRQADPPR